MKLVFTLEHKKALVVFLAIFALAAMMFFTSCGTSNGLRRTNPRWAADHKKCNPAHPEMSGYGPGGYGAGRMRN